MAPTAPPSKPSARTLRHQRITGQIHPLLPSKLARPNTASTDSFLSTKRDKRTMKSSSFVSRIASSSSKVTKQRTRRPSKKLISNLSSLSDALPEVDTSTSAVENRNIIKRESLKSKKGALKRKERVIRGEMDRFNNVGRTMAKIAEDSAATTGDRDGDDTMEVGGDDGEKTPAVATSSRWAALRGYISSTMETNPAFDKA